MKIKIELDTDKLKEPLREAIIDADIFFYQYGRIVTGDYAGKQVDKLLDKIFEVLYESVK